MTEILRSAQDDKSFSGNFFRAGNVTTEMFRRHSALIPSEPRLASCPGD